LKIVIIFQNRKKQGFHTEFAKLCSEYLPFVQDQFGCFHQGFATRLIR